MFPHSDLNRIAVAGYSIKLNPASTPRFHVLPAACLDSLNDSIVAVHLPGHAQLELGCQISMLGATCARQDQPATQRIRDDVFFGQRLITLAAVDACTNRRVLPLHCLQDRAELPGPFVASR